LPRALVETFVWYRAYQPGTSLFYTASRLGPSLIALLLWAWLADGSLVDPAHFLLLFAIVAGIVGVSSIRRYWHIRSTSRSRRDSTLIP
jgi:hypothetical protein